MNSSSQSAATEAAAKSKRLWLAIVLGALSAFGPLSLDMYLPALPAMATDFQTTTSAVQLSLTACLLGLSLGQLFAGPLSDIQGRRKPLLIGLAIYAVASILCVFSTSIWALVALRFIQGAAGSAGIVISRAMVRDIYVGPELTKFFALLMLVNGVAPIAAPIFGSQLLLFTPWEGVFVVLGAIGIIMLLVVLFGLPESLPVERRSTGGFKNTLVTFKNLFVDKMFMGFALSQGLVIAAMFAYISGSPFVLQNMFGVSAQMFSVFFAINGLGIILASQITGKLAGKISESKLMISGLILAAIGGVSLLIVILLGAGLYAILPPLFIIVSCVGIVSTAGFSLAMQSQGKAAGSASALLGVLSLIFGALLAPLVGIGGSGTAVPMGIVIAVADVGALLCYYFMVHKGKPTS
ncbi:Bcr/CflA family efflux MFS transporter [Brevibacillus laterosporus]|uniref:Bcr/CflA family efflux transporter n=1 Tax=Brevibacillus laterosporus LMG 15441 TaxID=1042163 RepID=A0A075RI55_BRELA|nr:MULTISPECIES: multidrug effflux MFS transporter [Brevibacillus]HAS01388.1 Bcr/CflA family drug resistance efflux transporter [Brevibacillus sp.]AIG28825.1 sulfonamide resistance protein [Brevibacillus laterosporus LMG 15441]AUM67140.1 Bcr/CflA family drug resistance efflux transporter [Brevibacillus laterosporus]ERM16928.1 MFS transporter [Brevibacillus laterosporus PE36]MBA4531691.1 multidrug effflux MFS transporter [Brevibacillus halotolerans]